MKAPAVMNIEFKKKNIPACLNPAKENKKISPAKINDDLNFNSAESL